MTGLGLCGILDVNSEDRGEPLPTSERWNKWARSVQSRLGVREEESPVWSSVGSGMACCSATREGGGFLGLHGTPPRNFWVCPQPLPPPGGGDCQKAGVSAAGLGGGGPRAEGGHRVQRHVRVLPHSRGDPHLRAGRQPGGPGRAHGGSSGSPLPHTPRACSSLGRWGWWLCQSSGTSLSAQGGRAGWGLD